MVNGLNNAVDIMCMYAVILLKSSNHIKQRPLQTGCLYIKVATIDRFDNPCTVLIFTWTGIISTRSNLRISVGSWKERQYMKKNVTMICS